MANVAFLGLGKMGSGMAASLAKAGHAVAVWNRSHEKARSLAAIARVAATPAEAARSADAIFSMVADDEASERAWLAHDGAFATARKGALVIECSTISHAHVMRLASEARARSLIYIDSPVNGLPSTAAAGKLILLVGAAPDDLVKARPFLAAISSSILHFGAVGTGTAFKLINNLLGAVHISALAEAVALATRLGLNRETLIAAIDSGPCASPHVKRLVAPMAEGRISALPGLSIGLREKDSRYCLALAKDASFTMSVGKVAHAWYAAAKPGLADLDDSALIQTVSARTGVI
jgi:3-hydroxyisobutyrate dehydrogenase